jgi:peptidoglycan/xylan/chitin deacetylase (PgdA/CDA1 family)
LPGASALVDLNQRLVKLTSLVTVGAHTISHPHLSRIPRESARSEIELSRSMLSAVTGQEGRLMSFPYGDYDQEVVAVCKQAGYEFIYGIDLSSTFRIFRVLTIRS